MCQAGCDRLLTRTTSAPHLAAKGTCDLSSQSRKPPMIMPKKQSGVGLIEVMVAAAVLSVSVAGTIFLTSTSTKVGSESRTSIRGATLGGAVAEIAHFKPEAGYINTLIGAIETGSASTSFSVDGVGVASASHSESVSLTVSWTNPYLTGESQVQSFSLASNLTLDDTYQSIQNILDVDSGSDGGITSTFTISTSPGAGTTISPSSASVVSGGSAEFAVGLAEGYDNLSVSGCSGSLVGTTYTTGTISENCTITVSADESSHNVATSSGTGVASLSCNASSVSDGGSVTCTASLSTGYKNLSLSGCGGVTGGSPYTTGAITGDCTVTATAEPEAFTVSTEAGAGTAISPSYAYVQYGASTSFTLSTTGGYTNLNASGCGGTLSGNTYTTGAITAACTVISSASSANQDPSAVNDSNAITEDVNSSVSGNVLDNDSDPDSDALYAAPVTAELTYGTLVISASGAYTYTLDDSALDNVDSGEDKLDSYTYTVTDDQGGSDTAILLITVYGSDEPPESWSGSVLIVGNAITGSGDFTIQSTVNCTANTTVNDSNDKSCEFVDSSETEVNVEFEINADKRICTSGSSTSGKQDFSIGLTQDYPNRVLYVSFVQRNRDRNSCIAPAWD